MNEAVPSAAVACETERRDIRDQRPAPLHDVAGPEASEEERFGDVDIRVDAASGDGVQLWVYEDQKMMRTRGRDLSLVKTRDGWRNRVW